MHRNIPELLVFFCLIFSNNKKLFFGLSILLYVLQLSERNGFCIGFIDFMFKGKSFFEYTNLFSPNDYEGNDNIQIFSKLKR